ncbi:MAG TPA: iron-sulfur cluster assembly protein, partial [Chryseolinea sp.]|nr:iron-sulfur cluster assembly protein [Chryseolinea sp.]
MSFTQADIIRALSKVEDPDLKRDLVTLNMIRDVKVYSDNVSFTVVLTTPACPLREVIKRDCEAAVREVTGEG